MYDSDLLLDVCVELLHAGQRARFRVEGSSMAPCIRNGNHVEVSALHGSAVRPGMVVLYRGPQGPLAHRVVERRGARLILRGDAAEAPDPPVSPDAVIGQVTRVDAGDRSSSRRLTPFWIVRARWRCRDWKRAASRVRFWDRWNRDWS